MKLHGAEAQQLSEKLTELLANHDQWEFVYWDPARRDLWLKSYPHSEMNGGGPPDLERTPPDVLAAHLVSHPEWMCSDLNGAVSFLIECWCERRALKALRWLLPAWPHNGLTDGFELLRDGLSKVRAFGGNLEPIESQVLGLAINHIDRALDKR